MVNWIPSWYEPTEAETRLEEENRAKESAEWSARKVAASENLNEWIQKNTSKDAKPEDINAALAEMQSFYKSFPPSHETLNDDDKDRLSTIRTKFFKAVTGEEVRVGNPVQWNEKYSNLWKVNDGQFLTVSNSANAEVLTQVQQNFNKPAVTQADKPAPAPVVPAPTDNYDQAKFIGLAGIAVTQKKYQPVFDYVVENYNSPKMREAVKTQLPALKGVNEDFASLAQKYLDSKDKESFLKELEGDAKFKELGLTIPGKSTAVASEIKEAKTEGKVTAIDVNQYQDPILGKFPGHQNDQTPQVVLNKNFKDAEGKEIPTGSIVEIGKHRFVVNQTADLPEGVAVSMPPATITKYFGNEVTVDKDGKATGITKPDNLEKAEVKLVSTPEKGKKFEVADMKSALETVDKHNLGSSSNEIENLVKNMNEDSKKEVFGAITKLSVAVTDGDKHGQNDSAALEEAKTVLAKNKISLGNVQIGQKQFLDSGISNEIAKTTVAASEDKEITDQELVTSIKSVTEGLAKKDAIKEAGDTKVADADSVDQTKLATVNPTELAYNNKPAKEPQQDAARR